MVVDNLLSVGEFYIYKYDEEHFIFVCIDLELDLLFHSHMVYLASFINVTKMDYIISLFKNPYIIIRYDLNWGPAFFIRNLTYRVIEYSKRKPWGMLAYISRIQFRTHACLCWNAMVKYLIWYFCFYRTHCIAWPSRDLSGITSQLRTNSFWFIQSIAVTPFTNFS